MGLKPIKFEIGKVPHDLITELQKAYQIKNFVETGTYLGETTEWASKHFEKVYTFEAAESIYKTTKQRIGSITNIEFILGESNKELEKIHISASAIFWLDAHYSEGDTFNGEVPLLKEIEIINNLDIESFIFIDDARLVLAKWQNLHYCDLATLINRLSVKNRYVAVIDDVIIGVPYHAKEMVNNYSQKLSEIYWNSFMQEIQNAPPSSLSNFLNRIKAKLKVK